MSDAKDQHEPSMEEILASIRRIISEEGEAPAAVAPAAAAAPAAPQRAEEDVLILTDEVSGDDPVEEKHGEAAPAEYPAPRIEPAPPSLREIEHEPARAGTPEPAAASERAAPQAAPTLEFGRRLISDSAAAASVAAMSELLSRSHPAPAIESLPMGQSDRTLEDITLELLRPVLKAWLDENLPQLVERAVREEIGRLALDVKRR